jgi:hypothetical protein
MKSYFHILTKADTEILFTNLGAVFARVLMLEVHNKKLRKKIAKRGNKGSAVKDLSARLD